MSVVPFPFQFVMNRILKLSSVLSMLALSAAALCAQSVVINEIMYHPSSQDVREEFVELFNPSATNVNLSGWEIGGGINLLVPTNTLLGPGKYLAIAADLLTFAARYPGVTNVVGGWLNVATTNVIDRTLTNFFPVLSNRRNTVTLDDSAGNEIDRVTYADDGDWAIRQRSPDLSGQRGWVWSAEHDGFGKSLELINAILRNDSGQNWASSIALNGTPGAVNSVVSANVAPLILEAKHLPIVPRSTEPVSVSARIVNETASGITATLFYRTNAGSPPPFVSTPMFDDGAHGDAASGDGIYGMLLPAMPNNTLIEFYIQSSDAQGNVRTWPAPALEAADLGGANLGQVANAVFQVDDSTYASPAPLYKLIMTPDQVAALQTIFNNSPNSDAQVNATFISFDGTGTEYRYLVGVRNRGHGSRFGTPHNYRVNFRSDEPWKGVMALNINARTVPNQIIGTALAQKAGAAGNNSHFAQLRVNNGAGPGGTPANSLYAANEVNDSDWAERTFPDDSGGNIYSVVRDGSPPNPRFDYRGEDKTAYMNTYFKESNASEDDWSDLIGMLAVMGENQTNSFTTERARAVVNVEQWLRHLAVMNLMGNNESGLNTGNNDDYYLYRGLNDPRFILVYHDFDQILGQDSLGVNSDIFRATCCPISGDSEGSWRAMNWFMHWPEFEAIYYRTLQDLLDTTFSQPQFDALVDQTFADFPQLASRAAGMKSWMSQRRTFVLSAISGLVPPPATPPIATVDGEPRSPTRATSASLTVSGAGITHYRFKLNNGSYGAETPVGTAITLSGLSNGSSNVVSVIGKNTNSVWQSTNAATLSKAWIVNTSLPGVRLNEVLARNDSAVSHSGTFPDVVELYNEGNSTIDLSGMRLTDDPSQPGKFVFPTNTTLTAGSYLVLYANNDDGTGGFHLGFSFSQNGDGLFLYDRATNGFGLLDSVEFGLQLPNLSIGRFGSSGAWALTQPTFGATNVVQATASGTALKINEWFAASEPPLTEDYIELFNSALQPVAIGGLYLTDQPIGRPARHRIPALSFIGAGGYFAFIADGQGDAGAEHVNFRLTSAVGTLALLNSGLALIDCVNYAPQKLGVSTGRCPDGALKIVSQSITTPSAPNYCPEPPPGPVMVNLLPLNQVWRFNENTNLDGVNWQAAAFNDSGWPSGPAVLGRVTSGSLPEPIQTQLTLGGGRITYYFRSTFVVASNFAPTSLQFSNLIDDGAVFYLNGSEAARYNFAPGVVVTNGSFADLVSGPPGWSGPLSISVTNLRTGTNVIAVEVHQASTSSGDIVFGTRLDALIVTNSASAAGVVINEVLADNGGTTFVNGRTPDWIEFYNPSTNVVDLAGMSINDQANNNPPRWIFPPGSIVPARGYLVIYADLDLPVSATNTGFGLKANGGSVYLFNKSPNTNQVVDRIDYGLQTPDHAIGRVPAGNSSWVLTLPTPGATNVPAVLGDQTLLRVNEWMADPVSGNDWFEIYNGDTRPVSLGGLRLTDVFGNQNSYRIPALSFIGVESNAFVRFEADDPATPSGPEHVNFKLAKGGDSIFLMASNNATQIDGYTFPGQQTGVSQGRLPDGATNIVFFPLTPTPKDANYLPLTNVVINEVLTHSDLPLEDAVELRNTTAQPIDVSGWWLSDATDTPRKFRIPSGPPIPAYGFKVLYEVQFNDDDTGAPFSFSSSKGDEVFLSQTKTNGELTGYRSIAKFGAAENGVSFGRYVTSDSRTEFVSMPTLSLGTAVTKDSPTNQITLFRTGAGATNPYPKVGPIVINEIMYHPPDIGTNDNVLEEFVELKNITGTTVPLYDPAYPTNGWRLRGGVDFDFNATHSLPAGGHLLVVSFDPATDATSRAAFQAKYGSNSILVGPYQGKLDNGGESVELKKPDMPQQPPSPDAGFVPYVLVEQVAYRDLPPWPQAADGSGWSMQRVSATGFGNDPTNWIAAAPTPGPAGASDSDGDGMPDDWEMANSFDKNNPADAGQDADSDGMTNLQEYLAGTNPRSASSTLRITATQNGSSVDLRFTAVAGKSYTVLSASAVAGVSWQNLTNIAAPATTTLITIQDALSGGTQRFYRIITPAQP